MSVALQKELKSSKKLNKINRVQTLRPKYRKSTLCSLLLSLGRNDLSKGEIEPSLMSTEATITQISEVHLELLHLG